jgi:hypothetical protein
MYREPTTTARHCQCGEGTTDIYNGQTPIRLSVPPVSRKPTKEQEVQAETYRLLSFHYNLSRQLRCDEPGSAVGIATSYGLEDRGVGVRVPVR